MVTIIRGSNLYEYLASLILIEPFKGTFFGEDPKIIEFDNYDGADISGSKFLLIIKSKVDKSTLKIIEELLMHKYSVTLYTNSDVNIESKYFTLEKYSDSLPLGLYYKIKGTNSVVPYILEELNRFYIKGTLDPEDELSCYHTYLGLTSFNIVSFNDLCKLDYVEILRIGTKLHSMLYDSYNPILKISPIVIIDNKRLLATAISDIHVKYYINTEELDGALTYSFSTYGVAIHYQGFKEDLELSIHNDSIITHQEFIKLIENGNNITQ